MFFPSLFIIFYTTQATSAFYLKFIHPPEFSRENEKISNLQLLLPLQPEKEIRLLKHPVYRAVDQPSHVVLLPDGPFSEIPSEDFLFDDSNVLFDKPAISRITKKDLSRSGPKAYDASDRRLRDNILPLNNYSPLDIAQRCVQIINFIPSKFQESYGYNKPKVLNNNYTKTVRWCRAYLLKHADSDAHNLERNNQLTSTNQNPSASFRGVGNAGVNGYGGFAGNYGANGHGDNAGNLGIGGIGGVMGNIGIGGVGGNIGSVDDWSSKLISDIVAGNQFVPEGHGFNAGNLAINGFGGYAGNAGFGGKGAHAGNLGIGGKGRLFGNLGIGGQGGLFGNVGIGGHAGHFMNSANEGGEQFANTLTQVQSPAPALGSAGVDYSKNAFGTLTAHADTETLQAAKEAKFDSIIGNAALHGTGGTIGGLGIGGQGLETGNLGVGGLGGSYGNLNINGLGGLLGNVAIGGLGGNLGNENINGNGDLAGNVAMEGFGQDSNNFAVGDQGIIGNILFESSEAKDTGKLTHITSFSNFKDDKEKEVARILTRQTADKNVLKYLVGALAHGGTGGEIGNIAIHPTKSSLAREEPCAMCVHMLVLKHFIAPKPGQSIRVGYLDANSTLPHFIKDISLGKFRPIGGRRDMPLIGGPVSPRFEMYMLKR